MNIPDEAVQAAADVWFMEYDDRQSGVYAMRAALAAALPHLCLFPNRLVPSGEYDSACGECQRCDPDGLLARIKELEEEVASLYRAIDYHNEQYDPYGCWPVDTELTPEDWEPTVITRRPKCVGPHVISWGFLFPSCINCGITLEQVILNGEIATTEHSENPDEVQLPINEHEG